MTPGLSQPGLSGPFALDEAQYTAGFPVPAGLSDLQYVASPRAARPEARMNLQDIAGPRTAGLKATNLQDIAGPRAAGLEAMDRQYIVGRRPASGLRREARERSARAPLRWLAAPVLCAALMTLGCAEELPPPVVLAVTPSSFDEGSASPLLVELDAVLPFRADHDARQLEVDEHLRIRIGDREVEAPLASAPGQWQVVAPIDLAAGVHDVGVTLGDGRSAVLPRAVQVLAVVLPDGFEIDPIPTQRRGVPFPITVRATGSGGSSFTGVARLSSNRGAVTPQVSDPFVGGVLIQSVTLNQVGNEVVISVQGPRGLVASSNGFRVTP